MTNFKVGLRYLEEVCAKGDNAISFPTLKEVEGLLVPRVRDVSAYYEDGAFYIITHAKSNKVRELEVNTITAFGVHFEGISGSAKAFNLGWVMKSENHDLRLKLREAFKDWYDMLIMKLMKTV